MQGWGESNQRGWFCGMTRAEKILGQKEKNQRKGGSRYAGEHSEMVWRKKESSLQKLRKIQS